MLQLILMMFGSISCGAAAGWKGHSVPIALVIGGVSGLIGAVGGLAGTAIGSAIALTIYLALPRQHGEVLSCSLCQTTVFTTRDGRCTKCGTLLTSENVESVHDEREVASTKAIPAGLTERCTWCDELVDHADETCPHCQRPL